MARPEDGLEQWQLRKLKELGVNSWRDADDAKAKLSAALKAKAKAKEDAGKTGFAAIDAKADDKPAAKTDEKKAEVVPTPAKVEVLPATQTVDVTAPVINVHVPAPGVTIHADEFKFWPAVRGAAGWVQAAIVGAAFYAAFSSRVGELLTLAMR